MSLPRGLLELALLFLLLSAASKGGRGKGGGSMTRATVAAVVTGGRNAAAWASSRYAALKAASPELAADVALSVLAHWALETANGAGEWNYNLGNIHGGSAEPVFTLPGLTEYFRSYGSLAEGVSAYLALVRDGAYAPCWARLLADPRSDEWTRCLGQHGYYTANVDTYAAGYLARRALIASTMGVNA